MTLHSWASRCLPLLLSTTVWAAETSLHAPLLSSTFSAQGSSEEFKISVDSMRPLLFLKSSVVPSAATYAVDVMGLIPLMSQPRSIPFITLHTRLNHKYLHLLSLGLGCRWALDHQNVLGAHLFLDYSYGQDAFFQVLETRIEFLSPHLEMNLNGYFPLTSTHRTLNKAPYRQYDADHHKLYELSHYKTARLGPGMELILGKRWNRFKYYGGITLQNASITHLGLLIGMEYPLGNAVHTMMNVVHDVVQSSTHFTVGFRVALTTHMPRPGSLQSRLYAPIERYTFYAKPHLVVVDSTEKPTCTLLDEYAWMPEAKQNFSQDLINAADSKATFYLRNYDLTDQELRYGTSGEVLTLQAGQSIIGTNAHLHPVSTEISETTDNQLPVIESKIVLPGQNKVEAIWSKDSLILGGSDIKINGLYMDQFFDFNVEEKAALHIKQGSNVYLENLVFCLQTQGNDKKTTKTEKALFSIWIENSTSVHISRLALTTSSIRDKELKGDQYHGDIHGVHVKGSKLIIQKSKIEVNIYDTESSKPSSAIQAIGDTFGVSAKEGSKVQIIDSIVTAPLASYVNNYEVYRKDKESSITVDGKEIEVAP